MGEFSSFTDFGESNEEEELDDELIDMAVDSISLMYFSTCSTLTRLENLTARLLLFFSSNSVFYGTR